MDVDNLLAGQRFDRELDKALTQCDVLVAVIGSQWMKLLSEKALIGGRDYVRDEIAAALKREIVVIPALVGREGHMPPLPQPGDLPDDIRDLVQYQKHSIVHESFGRNLDDLIAAIEAVRRGGREPRSWKPLAAAAAAMVLVLIAAGAWFLAEGFDMPTSRWSGPAVMRKSADVDATRKEADRVAAEKAAQLETKKKADEDAARATEREAKGAAEAKVARDAAAECDRLAAHPWDSTRPNDVQGVFFGSIDTQAAWASCNEAMRLNPNVPRLIFEAGRVASARKDFVASIELHRRAAAQGSASAMNGLGVLYSNGEGVTKDYTEAKNWFEKAAALGDASAIFNLGIVYENGEGVPRNTKTAREWYQKAADLGHSGAKDQLQKLK